MSYIIDESSIFAFDARVYNLPPHCLSGFTCPRQLTVYFTSLRKVKSCFLSLIFSNPKNKISSRIHFLHLGISIFVYQHLGLSPLCDSVSGYIQIWSFLIYCLLYCNCGVYQLIKIVIFLGRLIKNVDVYWCIIINHFWLDGCGRFEFQITCQDSVFFS